ncbi:MAG TPA: nuclear transport factor 2 family protein [Micromonospora sp.]
MTVQTLTAESTAVANVHRYYELVDAGDVAGLVGLFTTDATYHRPGYPPLVGHAGMTRFYSSERVIREGRHTLDTVLSTAGEVAVHGAFNGVLHDGREVSLRFADFFTVAPDGLFTRRDTFFFAPLV